MTKNLLFSRRERGGLAYSLQNKNVMITRLRKAGAPFLRLAFAKPRRNPPTFPTGSQKILQLNIYRFIICMQLCVGVRT